MEGCVGKKEKKRIYVYVCILGCSRIVEANDSIEKVGSDLLKLYFQQTVIFFPAEVSIWF